ncbi:class I SAM-dependent methyltransferase [Clostridiaceae bacterium UIB06]|uniref:Class I SAM-dependent methyltransferase n=1 Tax=Clostridium thailandense TaxID=2794346 RepID=A0A949TQV4_9CLOT|nr:class I SAM-dependent methyltransferase [Clostridium thailandense]MBV7273732.1 class I SAM-dependent methyltransferase [Clostridium thailandense]MCH5137488.1 class I SAM-dependent methyltransferase [Clostridiaceae bacterium UIB06]
MKWNSDLYDNKHSFVAEYGKSLIEFVNVEKNQKILDLGCGTGRLTNELVKNGATVIGIDSSADMIKKAKLNYPNLNFQVADATNLDFKNYFDTVFSNAVFHWIPNQEKLLYSIYNSLKDNGKLICEFGAKNNVYQIQTGFEKALKQNGYSYYSEFFLPSKEEYKLLLEKAGFEIEHIIEYDRPTPLADGEKGLRNWICQFFASYLSNIPYEEMEQILCETEKFCKNSIWKENQWIADYRRIQIIAVKNKG